MQEHISPQQAREQAAEALGFLASIVIRIKDEDFEIPQRGLLDEDQRERMNALELETESWDHEPDTTAADGTVIPGAMKIPHRKNGKLITPAYAVRVATALWGKEKYERYKAGGGRATDVTATLARLDRRVEEREKRDPKSSDRDSGAQSVADAD